MMPRAPRARHLSWKFMEISALWRARRERRGREKAREEGVPGYVSTLPLTIATRKRARGNALHCSEGQIADGL